MRLTFWLTVFACLIPALLAAEDTKAKAKTDAAVAAASSKSNTKKDPSAAKSSVVKATNGQSKSATKSVSKTSVVSASAKDTGLSSHSQKALGTIAKGHKGASKTPDVDQKMIMDKPLELTYDRGHFGPMISKGNELNREPHRLHRKGIETSQYERHVRRLPNHVPDNMRTPDFKRMHDFRDQYGHLSNEQLHRFPAFKHFDGQRTGALGQYGHGSAQHTFNSDSHKHFGIHEKIHTHSPVNAWRERFASMRTKVGGITGMSNWGDRFSLNHRGFSDGRRTFVPSYQHTYGREY